jgi:predicted DsbA family dithiol-disulfide isomerase
VAVEVEIWSDVACPWCYIGKRRFEAALAEFEHADEVHVTWRSFELDPSALVQEPGDRSARLAEKYGITQERARELEQHITDVAAAEGLDFRFDLARSGNTFDAHRVVHLAREHGCQDAMKERLLRANFTEGRLLSDPEELVALAGEVGLDADEVRRTLAGNRFAEAVRDDERTAASFGISGVPTFVVDRAIGASGAQPPEAMLELLRRGWTESHAAVVAAAGEGRDIERR